MKAIIQREYGNEDTLSLETVKKPVVKENHVLIEVHVANVASGDMRINMLDVPTLLKPIMWLMFGFKGPRHQIRGVTGSGNVVEIGKHVTEYKVGDRVNFINSLQAGSMAEYLLLKERSIIAKIGDNTSYIDAAPMAFGAMSSYHFINENSVKKGDQVLIYGASGSVGTYAVSLASFYGATVTGVSSKTNHDVLLSLGCEHVIDYKATNLADIHNQYDVIFDAVGKTSKKACKHLLKPSGKYLTIKLPTKESQERLEYLNNLLNEGHITTYIDKVYPIEQFKQAHKHVYTKHKVGNVVLEIK